MKQTICLNLAGLAVFGIMILTSRAAVNPSVLDQFEHPDRAALQKLRDTLWPEAQEANPIALKIVENALRALDQDREDDELPFTMPKKLSDAAAKVWQAPVRKKAEAGDMFFACVLGSMYLEGRGIEKDESKGLAWLQKAAEAQSALAHSWLGYAYVKGLGGPVDYSKAIEHYLQAGKLGLAAGWNNAGWHQSKYHLMSPEFPSPRECYEKAMAMNYPRACYNLGRLYLKGEGGVALDKAKGLSLIRQAAKGNCPGAKQFLADGYVLRYPRQYGDLFLGWALSRPPAGKKEKSRELLDALQHQKLDTAKLLIERERDKTFYIGDEESTTVMHAAMVYNQLGILHQALQKGGDLNARNDFGYTPLQLAVLYDRKVIIEYLIEQGARLDTLAAALSDNPDLLQEVLEADPSQVDIRDERGMTPLHLAARRRLLKNVELLLDFGADPNARNIFDETPLHTVIYSKNLIINLKIQYASLHPKKPEDTILSIIDMLLAYGADINAKDKVRQQESLTESGTPLMAAFASQYIPPAELLVARGAEVNVRNTKGRPAIYQAVIWSPNIALTMIARGANVNYYPDEGGSLLHSAVYSDDERLIEALLSHGVDINVKNQEGKTALEHAARMGKVQAISAAYQKHGILVPDAILSAPPPVNPLVTFIYSLSFEGKHYSEKAWIEQIERGMTNYLELINPPNQLGWITLPLKAAVIHERYEIAKWLIRKGADLNASVRDGDTPLFNAVKYNRIRMVKLLLENKADPNVKVKGVFPLQQARKSGHAEIIKLLLAYGAAE